MTPSRIRREFVRASVEVGFIIFLFYSNLLMGEFTRSAGRGKTLPAALENIATVHNFWIGFVAAVVAHAGFEVLRGRVENQDGK